MIVKCRSCVTNIELTGDAGEHKLIDMGMYCFVCQRPEISIHHKESKTLCGESLECNSCNNYILYYEDDIITKDEIYLDNDYLLIRNIKYNDSVIFIKDEEIITVPNIIQCNGADKLFAKLKLLVVFS